MPFSAEDLARTALVGILPRGRYRLAGQTDSRFTSFAANTIRIAYRQQGGTPSLLLFSDTRHNPQAAATAAAAWAEASWRPNAIQRKVRPGVVVVQVGPGNQLAQAGPVTGAAVPAAIWTVDSAAGKVETSGTPPGAPPGAEIRRAAAALMRGEQPPTLGELDLAEKGVMQLRTAPMPRAFGGLLGLVLLYFAFRYGLGGLVGILALPAILSGGFKGSGGIVILSLAASAVMLIGILLGAGLLLNFRNMALRVPGFSSPHPPTRNLSWGAYIAAMIGLAIVIDGVLPAAERGTLVQAGQAQDQHVTATAADDGGEVFVSTGGDLTVDLSSWPAKEWAGVQFKTSNPSVLSLDASPATGAAPIARYGAHETGAARVDATSADGTYTFQVRVDVGPPP